MTAVTVTMFSSWTQRTPPSPRPTWVVPLVPNPFYSPPSDRDWPSPGLVVVIKESYEHPGLRGKAGVVCNVAPSACSVFFPGEERTVDIAALHLAPVEPSRDVPVKVVLGAESRGMSGRVLSLDHEEQEGVVQLTSGDIKLFPLKNLCKTA